MLPAYAELHCLSSFSFLRGASQPDELVERAQALRYTALALTDECSVAGVVRAHLAAKPAGLPLVIGSEFTLTDGLKLVLYATDRQTYGDLTQLITHGRRSAAKGAYALTRADVARLAPRCLALWVPTTTATGPAPADAQWLGATFPDRAWIAVELFARAGDFFLVTDRPIAERRDRLQQIAPERGKLVIDPWRNRRENRAGDQAVAFEPAQCQGQHALRDTADRAAQFVKTQRA
jgi:DNA polymerase III alpha subunit